MAACVYTFYDFYKADTKMTNIENYLFMLFSRSGFIIGLACFIYPGCLGKASALRAVLGHDSFNVLSKSVFSMYMFNMEVIAFYWGVREDGIHLGEYSMWVYAIDICLLTNLVAIFTTLIYEYL